MVDKTLKSNYCLFIVAVFGSLLDFVVFCQNSNVQPFLNINLFFKVRDTLFSPNFA